MWQQRIRKMVRGVVLGGVIAMAAVAVGGSLGLQVQKRKGPDKRQTREPQLSFVAGTLVQSGARAWELQDGTPLSVAPGLEWRDQTTGGPGRPATGRRVRLTGQYYGSTLLVRQATLLPITESTFQALGPVELSTEPPDQGMPR